jgi:hypothetical protein
MRASSSSSTMALALLISGNRKYSLLIYYLLSMLGMTVCYENAGSHYIPFIDHGKYFRQPDTRSICE